MQAIIIIPEPISFATLRTLIKTDNYFVPLRTDAPRRSIRDELLAITTKYHGVEKYLDFPSIVDLIQKILVYSPDHRLSTDDCVDHRLWESNPEYAMVSTHDKMFPPTTQLFSQRIVIPECIEFPYYTKAIGETFINRRRYTWYNERMFFMAISIAHRFFEFINNHYPLRTPYPESEVKTIFWIMLYLSHKYHLSTSSPMSSANFTGSRYTEISLYGEMEYYIASKVLNYEIYHETVYEAADAVHAVLGEREIGTLMNHLIRPKRFSIVHGLFPREAVAAILKR